MTAKFTNPFWKQEQNALEILTRNKIETDGALIIRTTSEAILFAQGEKDHKKAWTAWLEDDERGIARLDPGFPAEY